MRWGLKKSVTWLAIYAVALHVILLGLAPVAATGSGTVDPFSVICHSAPTADAAGDQTPAKGGLVPSSACEHCNLCSAVAPPAAPDFALVGTMAPVLVLDVLRPASTAPRAGVTSDPRLARGPPRFV